MMECARAQAATESLRPLESALEGRCHPSVPPGGLFDTMFDLVYKGHEKHAWERFDSSRAGGGEFSREQ